MRDSNPWSDNCALCGEMLRGDAYPFYHDGRHVPVHKKCGEDKRAKERLVLAKAIEQAEDGPIVLVPWPKTWLHEAIALLIAFFAGAAVATCAFLLWW